LFAFGAGATFSPMSTRPFEQTVDVETPELVQLTYSLAGVGSRVLAGLTDLVICVVLLIVIVIVIAMVTSGGLGLAFDGGASWAVAVIVLAQFVIFWGYYVLFEGLMDGQTPGKRIHQLRVVREGGYSVTFGTSAVRNLVRMLDMQPGFFYFVGLSSLFFTKRSRRLGDLVAGTIVVREEIRRAAPAPVRRKSAEPGVPLQTTLNEDQYIVLFRFADRWGTIEPLRRAALAAQLIERFGLATSEDRRPPAQRLLELFEREKRAREQGVAARGDSGAARHRQALVAGGASRWAAFSTTLATVQKKGLRSLGEGGVREFVSEYRALSADLARLRTASAGRAIDEEFYLGRLVAAAHNILYRDRGATLRSALEYLFGEAPREIRRSAGAIGLAALLLFGPAVIAGVAIDRHPELAPRMLPPGMLDRAEDGVRRAKSGEGYIDDPQLLRPVMASRIMTNNVQVTFAVFAGGVSAGILSTLMLLLNGLSIGAVTGLYVSKGIGSLLFAFVAPHGVLELSAICIAGGGGYLLASAILLPGNRTRRRALTENSKRAIRLIAASTFLLIIAGTLEGFVSPIEWWPLELKLCVSALTAVFLYIYIRGTTRSPLAT
jgi:uncharacterized membrane protein SpoIIM required for sporulation/uncharacterized RDD family membrane protein YckC